MAFLGVEQSAKQFSWAERPSNTQLETLLCNTAGINALSARLLASRGIKPEELENFLRPRLRDLLPNPQHLKGFSNFAEALFEAHVAGETIGILADYDVDGATSAATMVALLRSLSLDFDLYVPDRLTEGYGPSDQAFAYFARRNIRTIMTLDCGSTSHGPVQRAEAAGLRVLVIDHHLIDGAPPNVTAHINPNQMGCNSGLKTCAAVGVCFVVVVGLRRHALDQGFACKLDPMQLLDLVALGTVCDVVPLKGLNRAYVLQGLKIWQNTPNIGMRALLESLPGTPRFDGTLAGFQIGPRLNAAGRIGPSDMAARLLTCQDQSEANRLAQELTRLNQQRRDIEATVLAQARMALHEQSEDSLVNLVANRAWHPGVVGIVAGRLKDSTGKPSIVLGGQGDQETLTGSGRSVPGFDLGAAVLSLKAGGVLLSGGGHAMAAGLKLLPDKISALREGLNKAISSTPKKNLPNRERSIDMAIRPAAATAELAEFLALLYPFGAANPEPVLAIANVRIDSMRIVGKNHLKVQLIDGAGDQLSGIAFRAAGTNLETVFRQARDRLIHVAGNLKIDEWAGNRSAQILIDDAALAT